MLNSYIRLYLQSRAHGPNECNAKQWKWQWINGGEWPAGRSNRRSTAEHSTASVCPSPHQCTISVRNVTVLTAIRATGMRAPYREHISDIACWNAPNQSITNFKFQNFGKTQTVESSAVQWSAERHSASTCAAARAAPPEFLRGARILPDFTSTQRWRLIVKRMNGHFHVPKLTRLEKSKKNVTRKKRTYGHRVEIEIKTHDCRHESTQISWMKVPSARAAARRASFNIRYGRVRSGKNFYPQHIIIYNVMFEYCIVYLSIDHLWICVCVCVYMRRVQYQLRYTWEQSNQLLQF